MYSGGIGVFIKLIHGERVTHGDGVCRTQILFHTHCVCFDVESTCPYNPLHSLFSLVSVVLNIIEKVRIPVMVKKSVEKQSSC